MNKKLALATIALVAVVMGMSTVAPMIQDAEASHGKDLPDAACAALASIPNPPEAVQQLIEEHCEDAGCPPDCPGGSAVSVKYSHF